MRKLTSSEYNIIYASLSAMADLIETGEITPDQCAMIWGNSKPMGADEIRDLSREMACALDPDIHGRDYCRIEVKIKNNALFFVAKDLGGPQYRIDYTERDGCIRSCLPHDHPTTKWVDSILQTWEARARSTQKNKIVAFMSVSDYYKLCDYID